MVLRFGRCFGGAVKWVVEADVLLQDEAVGHAGDIVSDHACGLFVPAVARDAGLVAEWEQSRVADPEVEEVAHHGVCHGVIANQGIGVVEIRVEVALGV
jgi:hypothetical protein